MALTLVHQSTSGNAFGTGAYTTASFTPAARRLLVVCQMQESSDSGAEGSDLTISDSDSGITSWTVVATSPNAPAGWSYGSRAWISDQAASGSSMTVSVDCGASAVENYRVTVWDVTDYGSIGATATGTDADGDGALALTLSAAPASSSICVAALNVALSAAPASSVTPNAAWTEVEDTSRSDWWVFQIQTRTGSTSTAVNWDDINTAGTLAAGAVAFAFEIVEGGGPAPQKSRPDADVTDGAWTPSTGADLYATIDEATASDADYDSTTSNSTARVGLQTLSTPAAGTQTLRARAAGSPAKKLLVRLMEGSTARATITVDPLTSTVTDYSATASGITDYSGLELEFEAADATSPPTTQVTWGALGTSAAGTTSANPTYTGIGTISAATSKLYAVATGRSSTASTAITPPSGWTSIGQLEGGTGTWGVDTGTRRVAFFVKDTVTGSESGSVGAFTFSAGDTTSTLRVNVFRVEVPGGYSISAEFTSGADTTNGTGYSATASSSNTFAPNDLLVIGVAQNIDTGTQSAQSITASGITFGTRTNRISTATTNGNDHRQILDSAPVSSGTATVAPTYAYTISTSGSGPTGFLRLRAAPPTEFARLTWAEFEVPAAAGAAPYAPPRRRLTALALPDAPPAVERVTRRALAAWYATSGGIASRTLTASGVGTQSFQAVAVNAQSLTVAGAGAASFASAALATVSLSSTGAGAASFLPATVLPSALSSAGVGAAAFQAVNVVAQPFTAAGAGAAAWLTAALVPVSLQSAGVSTASLEPAAFNAQALSSDGAASVTWIGTDASGGSTIEPRTITSAGTGAATFQALTVSASSLSSAGLSASSFQSAASVTAALSSAGSGVFSPLSAQIEPRAMSASGAGAASFTGLDGNTPTIEARTVAADGVAAVLWHAIDSAQQSPVGTYGTWQAYRLLQGSKRNRLAEQAELERQRERLAALEAAESQRERAIALARSERTRERERERLERARADRITQQQLVDQTARQLAALMREQIALDVAAEQAAARAAVMAATEAEEDEAILLLLA